MRKVIQRIACRCGFHAWDASGANVTDQSGRTVTLIWWECDACGQSRLKCILGNWEKTFRKTKATP